MSDADDKSTPFARRQVQWGRPPQTTFIAGPLPRGAGLTPSVPAPPKTETTKPAAAPAAPRAASRPASGNVLGGSLVPQRRATSPGAGPTFLTAPAPVAPQPSAPVPAARAPIDATPRPLPPVQAPEAALRAEAPAPAALPPKPQVQPVEVVVPIAARAAPRKAANRTPLYIAAAAVVVIGAPVATWLITRSNSEPAPEASSAASDVSALEASSPAAAVPASGIVAAAPSEALPVAAPTQPVATNAVRRAAAPRRAPVAASAATLAANTAAPAVTAPPLVAAPATPPPVVVIAPALEPAQPAGPAPTVARPTQSDPNAPVVTKPQPLD
ncbi:MAG: hypothetical protein P0Y52_01585 [Candidatus Brevundimonas phytovorans]|nr:hypothetical protein [Brevundimonas sp.]WEK58254.1 MAG: hypothetical protein P0Y52_01585 [Brevundimonas sp.]